MSTYEKSRITHRGKVNTDDPSPGFSSHSSESETDVHESTTDNSKIRRTSPILLLLQVIVCITSGLAFGFAFEKCRGKCVRSRLALAAHCLVVYVFTNCNYEPVAHSLSPYFLYIFNTLYEVVRVEDNVVYLII